MKTDVTETSRHESTADCNKYHRPICGSRGSLLVTMLRVMSREVPSPSPRSCTLSASHRRMAAPAVSISVLAVTKGTPAARLADGTSVTLLKAAYIS